MVEDQTEYEKRMELLGGKEYTMCERCGCEYVPDWEEAPEDATPYWEPHCPDCNAKITANPVTQSWLNIIGSGLERDKEYENGYEYHRDKVHAHARMFHGRLADVAVEDLVRKARYFDKKQQYSTVVGPRWDRDLAFNLRKQAREKVISNE